MKFWIVFLFFTCLSQNSFSQQNLTDEIADTTINTQIERLLNETSIIKKIEFVDIEKVKVLQFQTIIITNLLTRQKTKGLFLSNQSGANFWTGRVKGERHAFLDANEIDDLITFVELSDSVWKKEKPINETHYIFDSKDNLRVTFWTKKNSAAWVFNIKFTNYFFDNTEILSDTQSDEFLKALKLVKAQIEND